MNEFTTIGMANRSEVAQIRLQIEQECEAMQRAMTGFAITASHEFIHQKYENLGAAQHQLAQLVGEEEATQIVAETYIRTIG